MTGASARIIDLLRKELASLQARYPGYSMRRFSRKIDVSPPIVSQVLNGKRPLTKKLAIQLLKNLDLSREDKNSLIGPIPRRKGETDSDEISDETRFLTSAEMNIVSNWWNFAILRLLETKRISVDRIKWIANRLAISESNARASLEDLRILGLVGEERRMLKASGARLTTTTDLPSAAIRKHHAQGLELAQDALHRLSPDDRDFSALTLTFDPKDLPKVKRKLERFRFELGAEMSGSKKKEVFRVQIQVFPVSRVIEKEQS